MRLGHVHLKVRNLERSLKFYSVVLKARLLEQLGSSFAFLTMGDAHHELALQALGEQASSPARNAVGLYHTAFELADSEELLAVANRLKEMSTEYVLVDHGISWALYASDPDGNGLEFYIDRRHAADGKKLWNGESHRLELDQLS